MTQERTLSIIKPDGVGNNYIGEIIARFEASGLKPVEMRMTRLDRADAERFYAAHKERPFFGELVEFMISGPIVAMVLEGEDAIARNRELMGATDPAKADPGTIRADFSKEVTANTVHGSDSPGAATEEIKFFFPSA